MPRTALIVVDVQNDFCPGGALGVPDGDAVVPWINEREDAFDVVAFTQDWHPEGHCSFSDQPRFEDDSWPAHCVQGSWGAELHPDLRVPGDAIRIHKGTRPERDAYSGFDDTDLAARLREQGVERITIMGLATDYCVRATCLHALEEGFRTTVDLRGCRGIDPITTEEAARKMEAEGAALLGHT